METISSRLLGKVTEVKLQERKALDPMDMMPSGMVKIPDKSLQLLKALSPIAVTEYGVSL